MSAKEKDTLYRSDTFTIKPFEFDQRVVDVFPDMIKRSVPGYPLTISMIGVMANQYVQPESNIYDLGCSLGAVSFTIQKSITDRNYHLIAVDNSEDMINACNKLMKKDETQSQVEFIKQDLQETAITNASMVVMNFTLQFVPQAQRDEMINKIYQGLLPGGVLILSEKINFEDKTESSVMEDLHVKMKGMNGYNDMEIAAKRKALDNVLIPETAETHEQRLQDAGFDNVFVWLKCLNFVSFIAIK